MSSERQIPVERARSAGRAIARAATLALVAALVAVTSTSAGAIAVRPGYDQHSLADTAFGSAIAEIGFTVRIGDFVHDTLYVHMQGTVTFDNPRIAQSPRPLSTTGTTPIIAPFWIDVDTRMRASVTFGQGQFKGAKAFGVTWRDISPFSGGEPIRPENTFQLLMVDRSEGSGSGAFDLYFIYEQLTYDQGAVSRRRRSKRDVTYATAGADFADPNNPSASWELPGSGVQGTLIEGGAFGLTDVELAPTAEVRVTPGGFSEIKVTPPTEAVGDIAAVPAPLGAPMLGASALLLAWVGGRRARAATRRSVGSQREEERGGSAKLSPYGPMSMAGAENGLGRR